MPTIQLTTQDFKTKVFNYETEKDWKYTGLPAIIDFYADWCASCKEMEKFTFSDPKVQAKFSGMILLQADVTANTQEDKALLKRFRLFGPPGIIFFDRGGREIEGLRKELDEMHAALAAERVAAERADREAKGAAGRVAQLRSASGDVRQARHRIEQIGRASCRERV